MINKPLAYLKISKNLQEIMNDIEVALLSDKTYKNIKFTGNNYNDLEDLYHDMIINLASYKNGELLDIGDYEYDEDSDKVHFKLKYDKSQLLQYTAPFNTWSMDITKVQMSKDNYKTHTILYSVSLIIEPKYVYSINENILKDNGWVKKP